MLPEQQNLNQTMLDASQLSSLQQVITNFSPLQLAWASGYLAAKSEQGQVGTLPSVEALPEQTLTILYASQTGNAKGVACKVHEQALAQGISAQLVNVADFKPKSLKNETHLLVVASTNGEGEPPDDAIEFHEFLASKKAPKLDSLQFSVLSLGDSSYEFFCQTGKDFDERLAALGAKRITDRVDCDVDYEDEASQWINTILPQVKDTLSSGASAAVVNLPTAGAVSIYNKQNPYEAELIVSQKITGRDSAKDVRHVEIDLEGSGLTYQAGDALGVWFENDVKLVDEVIGLLSLNADEIVTVGDDTLPLKQALVARCEITQTAPGFVENWANISGDEPLITLSEDKNALREFASNHQVVDVIRQVPASVVAQDFIDLLRKITPRLYSIASSQGEVEEEVHLTVGVVQYEKDEQQRFGGASGFLANQLEEGGKVKVFVEHNDNFRLPADGNTPVIMIGPGTGIAPFRAFMQQRDAQEATGDNWLFFGDQTFTQDFLYQVEWQGYLKSGLLSKLSLAFSRDQAEKIYVQHRMQQQGAELYQWLERGAHIYVCGDQTRMAKDVHAALIDIVAEHGNKSAEDAEDYVKNLRSAKRYQRDVY